MYSVDNDVNDTLNSALSHSLKLPPTPHIVNSTPSWTAGIINVSKKGKGIIFHIHT